MSKTLVFSAAQAVLTLGVLGYLLLHGGQASGKSPAATAEHAAVADPHESAPPAAAEPPRTRRPAPAPAEPAHGLAASPSAKGEGHAAAAEPTGHEPKPGDGNGEAKAAAGKPAEGHGAPGVHGGEGGADPTDVAAEMLAGNGRFVAGIPSTHSWTAERARIAGSQHPKAMVLSCSDSRVPPEHVFDQGLGDLFVVRTAGNVADAVAVGSLEYAAEHLGPRLLIVLGHERCGAVTAAASGGKMPTKNLDAVVRKISPSVVASAGWAKGPALIRLAAETNVTRTADDLLKQSPVLRKLEGEGKIKVLRAMYDLDSGRVRPLP